MNSNERLFLILACLPYLASTLYAGYVLGARHFKPNRWNFFCMLLGFGLHTTFLYLRGAATGHCPLTNLFETLAFISWAIVLNYILLGPLFRVSLLGAFTAPLVLLINFFALSIPSIDQPRSFPKMGWMLEAHAALSILAYGTLGLAAAAGIMTLLSNHYLKTRSLVPLFYQLPALGRLEVVTERIAVLGWLLLTIGMGLGFGAHRQYAFELDQVKVVWSLVVWGLYSAALAGRWMACLSPIKFCAIAIFNYAFVLFTFFGINSLSQLHRFRL